MSRRLFETRLAMGYRGAAQRIRRVRDIDAATRDPGCGADRSRPFTKTLIKKLKIILYSAACRRGTDCISTPGAMPSPGGDAQLEGRIAAPHRGRTPAGHDARQGRGPWNKGGAGPLPPDDTSGPRPAGALAGGGDWPTWPAPRGAEIEREKLGLEAQIAALEARMAEMSGGLEDLAAERGRLVTDDRRAPWRSSP